MRAIGINHYQQGQLEAALKWMRKSLQLYQELDSREDSARIQVELAQSKKRSVILTKPKRSTANHWNSGMRSAIPSGNLPFTITWVYCSMPKAITKTVS
jgi:hypothetical protein